ncbi:MAG TPA: cell division protein FtsK [Kribbella sp.]|nr:cell division protein FtsK [Kribbella sp.]
MPIDASRLSRRTALRTAALAASAAGLMAGCKDEPDRSGTPGATEDTQGPGQSTPSTDPVIVAALRTAATQVQQLSLRYNTIGQSFPSLRSQLATGVRYHAAHLARLKELGGVKPGQPGKLPPPPKGSASALAELAAREQRLSVAHATAAAKVSGPAARLLASIAASENQLAASLLKKKAAR